VSSILGASAGDDLLTGDRGIDIRGRAAGFLVQTPADLASARLER
jgi:hypothetical protein